MVVGSLLPNPHAAASASHSGNSLRSRSSSRSRSFSKSRRLSNERFHLSPKLMAKSSSACNIATTTASTGATSTTTSTTTSTPTTTSTSTISTPLFSSACSAASGYNINNIIQNSNINSFSLDDLVLNVNLDNTLPVDYFKQDILSVLKTLKIPKWRKIERANYKKIHLTRISGAMTNCVYKVTYLNYYPILLRIYGDTENIIDRKSELLTLIRLSRKNIGPKLLGCFTNGRFEQFLNNSITLNKHQIRDQKISRMIARRMKEFHNGVDLTIDEISQGPKAWIVIDKWIDVVDQICKRENPSIQDQRAVFFVSWTKYRELINLYKCWLYRIYAVHHGDIDANPADPAAAADPAADPADPVNPAANLDAAAIFKKSLKFCHNDTQYGNLLFYSKSQSLAMLEEDETDLSAASATPATTNIATTPLIDDNEITNLSLNNLDSLSIRSHSVTNMDSELPIVTDSTFQYDTRLTVIDFEYAGQNLPAYDITNHFSEWMYDYHDPLHSYKTDESKYPSVEERINFLNQYVSYVPGSTTPHFNPLHTNKQRQSSLLKTSHSVVSMKLAQLPPSVVNLYNETIYWRSTSSILWSLWAIISGGSISNNSPHQQQQQQQQQHHHQQLAQQQQNQDPSLATPKFETGPNGETYKIVANTTDTPENGAEDEDADDDSDDEFQKPTLDDEFNHLKYTLGKNGIFIGDLIQFDIISKDSIDQDMHEHIKYLDTNLLPL